MYASHWGLAESPFRPRLDPRLFYESPTHEEALARLHFLVEQRRRLGLLIGPHGSGKSLLLDVFAGQIRGSGRPVGKVNLVGLTPCEFLWQLAVQLGINPRRDLPASVLWQSLLDRITEFRYQQAETVVLLDDAGQAGPELLVHVLRMAQLDLGPDAQLTIVLVGRQEEVRSLGSALLELVDLRMDVDTWDSDDTRSFLDHCLSKAGRRTSVFDDPAVLRLHELGHGIPRRITRLAELALLAGASQQLDLIDVDTVESVYHELAVTGCAEPKD